VNRVVLATSSEPVGVDVEKIRDARMNVASRYFSTEEIQMLDNMPTKAQQDQLFYQLWTAREAYLKFLGTGISYGLSGFSIEKLCSGEFRVSDPNGVSCKLSLYPLKELYQLAVCNHPEEEVILKKTAI
jgi:4'-phosphopantetheinyl transferase